MHVCIHAVTLIVRMTTCGLMVQDSGVNVEVSIIMFRG
jgi:hypothetical protein